MLDDAGRDTSPDGKRPTTLLCGPLELNSATRQLRRGGLSFHLTPKECQLLGTFIEHRGQVLTRQFLMREVWQTDFVADTRTLEVHVHWLRKKLDSDGPVLIHTVRGVGYMLSLTEESKANAGA